jgi:hypothetical protein
VLEMHGREGGDAANRRLSRVGYDALKMICVLRSIVITGSA